MKIPHKILGQDIEPRNMTALLEGKVVPILSRAKKENHTKGEMIFALKKAALLTIVLFIAIFMTAKSFIPDTTAGEILTIVMFPVLFLCCFVTSALILRKNLTELFMRTQERFLIRTEALTAIANEMNVEYVPVPGGPSSSIKAIAKWRFCPQAIKNICALMEDHGGFENVSDVIRASGLTLPREIILGSDEVKSSYYQEHLNQQQFENGFKGTRGNISFTALKWTESHDETTTHHLLVALELPRKLTGRIEFKNKAAKWPMSMQNTDHNPVQLLSKTFAKAYDVRANDQMEARLIFDPAVIERLTAYGAQGPVRGVAFDNHLVVDLAGENLFDILDLLTGEWKHDRIQTTLDDLKQMLGFVDVISDVFRVKQLK